MSAFRVPLTILQGATWVRPLVWKAGEPAEEVDLTGCSARMQIRSAVDSATVLLELTTGNGRIELGGLDGTVTLKLSAAETEALTWRNGVYDLEVVHPGGQVRRLAEGSVKVKPEVTRL